MRLARCPTCFREVPVTKNGRLWLHSNEPAVHAPDGSLVPMGSPCSGGMVRAQTKPAPRPPNSPQGPRRRPPLQAG